MQRLTYRRDFLRLACSAALPAAAPEDALGALEAQHGGRLGLFAFQPGNTRILAHRADERFTLCSTVKFPLAACVLPRVAACTHSLADFIPYTGYDLKALGYPDSHCPVTAAHVAQGGLTLAALCKAAVSESDNLAANLLFTHIASPDALTAFLHILGDTVSRSDRIEPALNAYEANLDTTSPRAMAATASKILLGDVLPRDLRALLDRWLVECQTGLRRLRLLAPHDWRAGDKTGTSDDESNDVALFRPPGRKPLIVAAYYNAPNLPGSVRDAVLAEAGAIAIRTFKD